MKTKQTYKAQALAIIMVILVIASIIGFSVFSRQITQKRSVVEERNSAEALEVTDIILDNFLLSKPEEWVDQGMEAKLEGYTEDSSPTGKEITDLSETLGNEFDFHTLSICPLTEGSPNAYTLNLSRTNEDTIFYLRPGETFTFPINGESFGTNCSINITFPNPPENGGFTIDRIFTTSATSGDILEYDYDNTRNYCFGVGASFCNNTNFTEEGWTVFNIGETLTVPISSSYPFLDKIQLTAIGNTELGFKFSMSSCEKEIQHWQLRASATCGGSYRAKEVIVSEVGVSYSIFNYVLFNGKGNLTSAEQ